LVVLAENGLRWLAVKFSENSKNIIAKPSLQINRATQDFINGEITRIKVIMRGYGMIKLKIKRGLLSKKVRRTGRWDPAKKGNFKEEDVPSGRYFLKP
jgi:hypothetical protein